jgi:2-polyprenyl-3-methyl-5-hydroxy-6-metoxy-1,4-benzoquinol methylase
MSPTVTSELWAKAPEVLMQRDRSIHNKMKIFFEGLWRQGDLWALSTSAFERAKYGRQLEVLGDERFGRVLEIGCGAGAFTHLLAQQACHVTAIDISPTSISQAKCRFGESGVIEFREANIMDEELRGLGPWDLIVMSETIYYSRRH